MGYVRNHFLVLAVGNHFKKFIFGAYVFAVRLKVVAGIIFRVEIIVRSLLFGKHKVRSFKAGRRCEHVDNRIAETYFFAKPDIGNALIKAEHGGGIVVYFAARIMVAVLLCAGKFKALSVEVVDSRFSQLCALVGVFRKLSGKRKGRYGGGRRRRISCVVAVNVFKLARQPVVDFYEILAALVLFKLYFNMVGVDCHGIFGQLLVDILRDKRVYLRCVGVGIKYYIVYGFAVLRLRILLTFKS